MAVEVIENVIEPEKVIPAVTERLVQITVSEDVAVWIAACVGIWSSKQVTRPLGGDVPVIDSYPFYRELSEALDISYYSNAKSRNSRLLRSLINALRTRRARS